MPSYIYGGIKGDTPDLWYCPWCDMSYVDTPENHLLHEQNHHQAFITGVKQLPPNSQDRKQIPLASGVLDYFPDALIEVAKVSKAGNDQHNPGQPLHWDRSKSTDHADSLARHLLQRGSTDTDGMLHSAKVAWRALALLQEEIEKSRK